MPVLVGAGGIAIIAATGVWALSGGLYGCTSADQALAPTLASLSILDAHPSQTQPKDERHSGCDEDDGFAYAGAMLMTCGSGLGDRAKDVPSRVID